LVHKANRVAAAVALWAAIGLGQTRDNVLDARTMAVKTASRGLSEARVVIAGLLKQHRSAFDDTYLAELMKLTGDPRAGQHYEDAIQTDPDDPRIEFLFGEYMRNFRGPLQPLFGEAERHFSEASRKLACAIAEGKKAEYVEAGNQLTRSIVALYETDGFPIYSWAAKKAACDSKSTGVSLFLSTGVRGGEGITDLDVDSDVRALTAAEAYSQSLRVNFGLLSTDLLRAFLRTVTPFENRNRLRTRYKGARLDLFFNDHTAGNAAVTNPILKDPTFLANRDLVLYNALRLNEFGVSVERPFHLFRAVDADLSVTYSKIHRTGLIDYFPDALEDINQVVVKGVVSRFVGPDKINADVTFVNQNIRPASLSFVSPDQTNLQAPPQATSFGSRGRQIYGGTFRYQIYRLGSGGYGRFFQGTRGLEFYAGTMHNHENFGYTAPAIVNQQDYFAGATLHALRIHGLRKLVDLSIQPTWFTSLVPSDALRNNRQYRTAAYGMLRLVDEERNGLDLPPDWHGLRLGFVHLTVPVQSDIPQRGISAFANQKVGAELSAKWFTTDRGGTTFLGSARYDVQRFTTLNRTFSLFTLGVSMGF
jgi:hypothetical protein